MELIDLRHDSTVASSLDEYDGRNRLLCALAAALTQASLGSWVALAVCLPFPAFLVVRFGWRAYRTFAVKAFFVGAVTALMIALTWSGEGIRWWGLLSADGTTIGLKIAVRLQLITATVVPLVVAMGVTGLEAALERLGAPVNFRVLVLLMLRSSLLLTQTMNDKVRALSLRAAGGRLTVRLNGLACAIGGVLIESSDRSERSWMALQCRGGLAGFRRDHDRRMSLADWSLVGLCGLVCVVAWGVEVWRF